MAISNIKVPALPESIADATVAAWHKKPGDFVKRDENIVDLETDKVVLEVPALEDGILKEIVKPVGSTVLASEILGTFEAGASKSQDDEPKKGDGPVASTPTPISEPTLLVTPTEAETKSVQHLSPSV